jgi:hypothetical protein
VKFNTISNGAVSNTTGYGATCGYQAGVADVGTKDLIVNNSISGIGYTPQTGGDCTGTPPAFLRFVDPVRKPARCQATSNTSRHRLAPRPLNERSREAESAM